LGAIVNIMAELALKLKKELGGVVYIIVMSVSHEE
jgi:hypothetical protein